MQQAMQLVALAAIAAILSGVVQAKGFDVLLVLAACTTAAVLLLELLRPLLSFAEELQDQIGVDEALMTPLWKVLGITLVCRMGTAVCTDAGQKALGELVQRGGELLALCAALPLMRAVLRMIQTLTGG